MNRVTIFLRIESFIILAVAITSYLAFGYNGWLFLLFFFTPDISILGYLINAKIGAFTYNFVHNFSLPLLLLAAGYVMNMPLAEAYALIWLAHVAFDRTIGFGLNYADRFGHTTINDFDLQKTVARLLHK